MNHVLEHTGWAELSPEERTLAQEAEDHHSAMNGWRAMTLWDPLAAAYPHNAAVHARLFATANFDLSRPCMREDYTRYLEDHTARAERVLMEAAAAHPQQPGYQLLLADMLRRKWSRLSTAEFNGRHQSGSFSHPMPSSESWESDDLLQAMLAAFATARTLVEQSGSLQDSLGHVAVNALHAVATHCYSDANKLALAPLAELAQAYAQDFSPEELAQEDPQATLFLFKTLYSQAQAWAQAAQVCDPALGYQFRLRALTAFRHIANLAPVPEQEIMYAAYNPHAEGLLDGCYLLLQHVEQDISDEEERQALIDESMTMLERCLALTPQVPDSSPEDGGYGAVWHYRYAMTLTPSPAKKREYLVQLRDRLIFNSQFWDEEENPWAEDLEWAEQELAQPGCQD